MAQVYLIFFIFLTTMVYAENSTNYLSLEKAISSALEKNLNIRAAKNTLRSSELNLLSSRYSLYPSASGSLSGSEGFQTETSFSSSTNFLTGKVAVGINYELSIFKFKNHSAEEKNFEATLYEINNLRKGIITQVIKEYIQIVGALKVIEVEKQNVVYQQHKLEEIETLIAYGKKSKTDLFQQKATFSSAQYRLLNAQLEYKQKMLEFTTKFLLSYDDNYQLDTSIISKFISYFNSKNVFNDSIPETDNIKAKKNKIVAAKLWVDAAKLNYFPTLSIYSGLSLDKRISNNNLEENPSIGFNAGISLEIPIFDKKQRWIQLEKAKNYLENTKLEFEQEIQTYNLNIRKAMLNDTLISEKIVTALSNLDAAKESFEAMKERYKSGIATLTELTATESTFLEANLLLLNAQIEKIISYLNILYYLDKIEDIPFVSKNITQR